jgi:hypothetical protein
MSIDRIGKGGPPAAPPPEKTGGSRVTGGGPAFEVNAPRPPAPAQAAAIEPPRTALDRWRAGEIDLNAYLDLKVDEATAHLAALPPAELEAIQGALRERIANDPMLVELVRTATGRAPDPSGDQ